jgi:RNA-binding protein 5/10
MIDHGSTMYPARSKQVSSDGRSRQYMNSSVVDLCNDSYHMSDSYNDHQVDRDWIRRLNRDIDSKSNRHREDHRYNDDDHYHEGSSYRDEDNTRERYSNENAKGKHQRNDYKRYSDVDKRLYREDSSDRKGYGSQGSYPRDLHDTTDLNKSKDQSRDPRGMKDSRESLGEEKESGSRLSGSVRDKGDSESSRESRSSGRGSKSSKELQERRDSKHDQADKDRNKRESSWNGCDDDGMENMNSLEHVSHTALGESRDGDSYKNQAPNNTIMIRGLAQHITENDIRQDILRCGLMPKDIRLIRKKDTGASRGFAFVEINTLQESSQWMEMKRGVLKLQDH